MLDRVKAGRVVLIGYFALRLRLVGIVDAKIGAIGAKTYWCLVDEGWEGGRAAVGAVGVRRELRVVGRWVLGMVKISALAWGVVLLPWGFRDVIRICTVL